MSPGLDPTFGILLVLLIVVQPKTPRKRLQTPGAVRAVQRPTRERSDAFRLLRPL